jgi:hypothetical protein
LSAALSAAPFSLSCRDASERSSSLYLTTTGLGVGAHKGRTGAFKYWHQWTSPVMLTTIGVLTLLCWCTWLCTLMSLLLHPKELGTCGLQAHESPMHCLHTWQADQLRPFLHLHLPGRQRSCGGCWAHSADALAGNAAHLDSLHLGNGSGCRDTGVLWRAMQLTSNRS